MILYVETNYVIGAAKGQDNYAHDLLRISPSKLRIALPSVSIMEAWSVFEGETKRSKAFRKSLEEPFRELPRDGTSPHAKDMLKHLQQAAEDDANLLNDIELRLRDILAKLAGQQDGFSAVELLPLTDAVFAQSLSIGPTEDPTDNLILTVILSHARLHPQEQKFFLSGNNKHFGTLEVSELLSAGIEKYLARTEHFLGWFHSQESTKT